MSPILCFTAPPTGLLGNANGNMDDDLQTPDHIVIASNATSREVFEKFGMTCKFNRHTLCRLDAISQ